ncbi:protease SohB [Parahaliea aestuarii]|uniref:Protease SohB n=1 Tax=Parahaliea aestuarii TaxID=1852021 RepID=A0A5C8ZTN3_9GAMM|nr:protease SohB [Parahaliea aestuarii]TXS91159.1 protease SohB [Parahaliea aestuarii]
MEFLTQYGLFLAQAVTVVVAILVVLVGVVALGQRQRSERDGHIEIRHLNERYRRMGDALRHEVIDKHALKAEEKAGKKAEKQAEKARSKAAKKAAKNAPSDAKPGDEDDKPRLYCLHFDGDIRASASEHLREEISTVLSQAREKDAVLLCLESPGGMVHSYGFAASQLERIRAAGIELTVAVDKVAASGGYMMACVANRIIAAPFAVIGSIGVLAQLPNFHRLLKKHDVDFELLTAGEYKRTLTVFGENTDKGREKFQEELEITHDLFKDFIREQRPQLDVDRVATGEVWYGRNALAEGLIDELQTSDAYIQQHLKTWEVYEVRYVQRKAWQEKLGMAAEGAVDRSLLRWFQRSNGPHF